MAIPAQLADRDSKRFQSNITKSGDCWLWNGDKNHAGYGRFSIKRKKYLAHRVSFRVSGNEIKEDMVLDHLCRVRNCVNPAHLEQVTHRENTLRGDGGWATGRTYAARTHCPNGHEYVPENVYSARGMRECKVCRNTAAREYQRRRRAELKADRKGEPASMRLIVTDIGEE